MKSIENGIPIIIRSFITRISFDLSIAQINIDGNSNLVCFWFAVVCFMHIHSICHSIWKLLSVSGSLGMLGILDR